MYTSSFFSVSNPISKINYSGSEAPGPRIGAGFDGEYFTYILYNMTKPERGSIWDDINTGVFIIKPDKEEFLYLLNLRKNRLPPQR